MLPWCAIRQSWILDCKLLCVWKELEKQLCKERQLKPCRNPDWLSWGWPWLHGWLGQAGVCSEPCLHCLKVFGVTLRRNLPILRVNPSLHRPLQSIPNPLLGGWSTVSAAEMPRLSSDERDPENRQGVLRLYLLLVTAHREGWAGFTSDIDSTH